MLALLEQNHGSDSFVLDDNQPFIREVIFCHGRQPSIVAFTDQTVKDVSPFCTRSGSLTHFSPLLIDTTFNIAEYYFTQTAYENLSLRKKDTGKHPWFPGPILVHRNKTTEDFKYFWQAVKRENCQLEGLHVLGSDEDEALFTSILQETTGTIHLLGLEHVQANVEKKLTECNFPVQERKIIMADIFGGRPMREDGCLYDCESEEEFGQKCETFKKKWDELEKSTTKNNPLKFTKYFAKYKEIQLRNKMSKYVQDRAGVGRGFGQNPIEWMHYMSKVEIDELGDGVGHRDVNLTTAIRSLKGRVLRLHKDAAKALYGDGPYRLDKANTNFGVTYDEWQDLLPGERKALLKRFFAEVCRPVVTNEGKQKEIANK